MKEMKKKGFTLVELVIVIAVIAILAAVLIPTFGSMIKKSSISADALLAKNLNTSVSIYKYENGILDITFSEAIIAVNNQGYDLSELNAKTNDCYFVWEDESNQFILIEETNNAQGYEILFRLEQNCYEYDSSKGVENKNWCFATNNAKDIEYLSAKYSSATFIGID